MAAVKKMTIVVKRDGAENLSVTVPQTRANLAKLTEAFGEPRVLKVRNPWGRKGAPKVIEAPVATAKKVRKPRAATVKA